MLYDQALISTAYIETYQITGDSLFARTAREIFDYVLRDMTDPGGAFYSAEDADSEKPGAPGEHVREAFEVSGRGSGGHGRAAGDGGHAD